MGEQIGLNIFAQRARQVEAETVHDLNDKKISELTQAEAKQVREDWDVYFNDLDYRDGRFKVVPRNGMAERFHDKVTAMKRFWAVDGGANLFNGKALLMTRDN